MDTYCNEFSVRSDELAAAIFCNAFGELECPIRSAAPGTKVERMKYLSSRAKFVEYMYEALEKDASFIETNAEEITHIPHMPQQRDRGYTGRPS